ncbi:MAG: chromosome segregation protein SMC, partial [Candidatus Thermoplasmatota archaeon]|nr:chromosome segregation protein SMC [Candidatus Thermoplasmatota archaeon]
MHLKEIRMENFKTFRKKVTIPIYEGFTGITGPNGSGKSNVADAILFVLGPRSSKMVRAKRLEDLIFHGNNRFKAANECKVSLVFDNSDRMIPIDSDKVTLKRVIRRSRSDPKSTLSYFYVNGRTSSQSQFENILTHAHLSAEGYNIVLQGHIADFINKTPVRIREEIDEIAGIKKYEDEIKVAHNKKNKTETNMEKIGWLLDQIKVRLRELRKEKEEAEKYRNAQMEINESKALYYHLQETAVRSEIGGYRKAISNAEDMKIKLRGEIERLESSRAHLEKDIREIEQEIEEITGEEGRKLKVKLDEAKLELMRAKDVIITAEDTLQEIKGETVHREQEKKDILKKRVSLEKEIERTAADIDETARHIEENKKKIEELENEMERSDEDLLVQRRDLSKLSKELETSREKLSGSILEKDRASQLLDIKRTKQVDAEQMVSTLKYEIKELKSELGELSKGIKDSDLLNLQKEYMSSRSEEKLLGTKMRDLEKEILSLNRNYTRLKVELETSENLKKGMSMAVDTILSARDRGEIRGIFGTIGELANVPDDYSTALEVAAGSRISAVLVDNDEVAARCIELLRSNKKGRATFLPLNKLSSRRPGPKALMIKDDPHVVGLAVDLISFEDRFKYAFQWAFGDTVVVDQLSTLRRLMGGVRLVTLQGEIAGAGGDITGGSLSSRRSGPGFGKRSRSELESISEHIQEKTAESDRLTSALNEARDRVSRLEADIRKITSAQSDAESRKRKIDEIMTGSTDHLGEKERELAELSGEIEALTRKLREVEDSTDGLEKIVEEMSNRRNDLQEKLERSTPKAIRDKLRGLRTDVDSLSHKRVETAQARNSAMTQKELFGQRILEIEGRMKDMSASRDSTLEEMKKAREKEERYGKEVHAMEAVLSTIDEKTKDLYDKRNGLGRDVEKVMGHRERSREGLMTQDQVIITQRTNIRIGEDKLGDILTEKQAYVNIDIPDPPHPDVRDLQRKVRELETILENVGNVNLKALEEYEEMEKKKMEIQGEMKALDKEKTELEKLIDEINNKRKEEFMYVYRGVGEKFREIYQKVSSGGEAYFDLENEEDPLSGGLNIHVQPPEKKMTRLGALSGGEKSLTSMAFIFAVQAWDPSPFYLLDEVDQNLDSVNAEIIARMV